MISVDGNHKRGYSITVMSANPNPTTMNETILETLSRVNATLAADANALTSTRSGEVNPGAAYIELVRELLALAKPL